MAAAAAGRAQVLGHLDHDIMIFGEWGNNASLAKFALAKKLLKSLAVTKEKRNFVGKR